MLPSSKKKKQRRPLTMPRGTMRGTHLPWVYNLTEYESYLAGYAMAITGHALTLGEIVAIGNFESLTLGAQDGAMKLAVCRKKTLHEFVESLHSTEVATPCSK